MNRKIPLWFALLVSWLFCVLTVTFGWAVWRIYNNPPNSKSKANAVIIAVASFPHLIGQTIRELGKPSVLIQPNFYPSINGFTRANGFIDSNYILLPIYEKKINQSVVKLIRISDQRIIHEWIPNFNKLKALQLKSNSQWQNKSNELFDIEHPLMSSDGSIIFHSLGSPLIKMDKNSNIIWVINGNFSHSLEYDADENIWVPSEIKPSKFFPNILIDLKDDAITKVSPSGKILYQKSVSEILFENGYRGLLLGVGEYELDLIHLNDIQPAITSTRFWNKGDLLVSLRSKSTVFLYRPSTNKILWLKTGPWLRQHDVDFVDSTHIGIFGNNTIRKYGSDVLLDGYNDEYIYDFKTNTVATPYTAFFKRARITTQSGGRSDILPNGDIFVEETDKYRLLRGNKQNIIWQYVDKIDQNSVSALAWSRFINKRDFEKLKFLK